MNRQLENCRRKSRRLVTPEHEENTEDLLKRAKNLINAEYRDAMYSKRAKGRVEHVKTTAITPAISPKRYETAAVKAARLKIQSEWEALKNGSIISDGKSPPNNATEHTSDKGATALRGIVAYVEMKNTTKLPAMKAILENMGATVSNTFSKEVTHVIFKQGSVATVQKAKFLNVHLVSVLWIEACKNSKTKVLEKLFPVVDFNDYTASPKVFRRFMEMGQKDREKLMTNMLQGSQDKEVTPRQNVNIRSSSSKSTKISHSQQSPTDDSMKISFNRTSNRIISETQDSREVVGSQLKDMSNACEGSKESNSSSIRLHISTDDSSNKISIGNKKTSQPEKENINSDGENSFSILNKRNSTLNLKENRIVKARRLFASARDSCIDDGTGCVKKNNLVLKRKLFAGNPVDDSFSKETSDSDLGSKGSLPKVKVINPYQSKEEVRKRKRGNLTRKKCDSSLGNVDIEGTKKQSTPNIKEVRHKSTQVQEKPKQVEDRWTQVEAKVTRVQKKLMRVEAKAGKVKLKSTPVKIRAAKLMNTVKKARIQDGNKKLPSIVSTSLHTQENKLVRVAIDTLGQFEFKACVVEDTTHVVAGEPRRTLNLLKGICRGCWVLRQQWVINSVAAGRWLPEDSYEMTEFSKVVQKSRIERQTFGRDYRMDIFTECGPIYIAPRSEPSDKDLKELVLLCGGEIVSLARKSHIVVGEKLVHHDVCVSYVWILDSVEQGRCKSIKKYTLVGT